MIERALALKRKADSVLEELMRSLFEEVDIDQIRREVARLRAATPGFVEQQHARLLVRRTAIRCAAAGAVTGLPFPGVAAIGTLGADLAYLMYQQFRLVLGIATIYGHEPSSRERFQEVVQSVALASGAGLGKQGIATGMRLLRDRISRFIPMVGAVSGGALNYASVHAVGLAAIRYYEARVDPLLADEIWAEGDREHA